MKTRYKYNHNYFTYDQLVPILKRRYGKNWQEKMDIATKYPVEESFSRTCLKCSRDFKTVGRYTRVCSTCKSCEDWKDAGHAIL